MPLFTSVRRVVRLLKEFPSKYMQRQKINGLKRKYELNKFLADLNDDCIEQVSAESCDFI